VPDGDQYAAYQLQVCEHLQQKQVQWVSGAMFGHPGATGGIVSPNMDVGASNTCQAGVSKQGSCQNHGGGEFDDIDIEGFGNAGAVDERCDVGHGGGAPEERWGVDADAAVSRAAVGKSDELRSGRLAEGTGSVIFKGKAAQQQRDTCGGLEPANIKPTTA
jgi:hypothetical protein